MEKIKVCSAQNMRRLKGARVVGFLMAQSVNESYTTDIWPFDFWFFACSYRVFQPLKIVRGFHPTKSAFPNDDNSPSTSRQTGNIRSVTFSISGKLVQPKFTVTCRCSCVLAPFVSMPIATMYENNNTKSWENQIGRSWQ